MSNPSTVLRTSIEEGMTQRQITPHQVTQVCYLGRDTAAGAYLVRGPRQWSEG